jgi:hypothetical protein
MAMDDDDDVDDRPINLESALRNLDPSFVGANSQDALIEHVAAKAEGREPRHVPSRQPIPQRQQESRGSSLRAALSSRRESSPQRSTSRGGSSRVEAMLRRVKMMMSDLQQLEQDLEEELGR